MDIQDRLAAAVPTVREHADRTDSAARFPEESIDALAGVGLLGLTLPEDAGGLGASPGEFVQAVSEVAGACGSTAMVYLMHIAASEVIAAAPPASAGGLLDDLAAGSRLATLAFSEKGSRSHFWAPVSRAQTADADRIRVRAEKSWVTSASHADVYVVSTGAADAAAADETDLYLVHTTAEGVEVQGAFDGIGLRGNDSAPVSLDVEVSVDDRLGREKAGFGLMMQTVLPVFSLGNSAVTLGCAGSALDAAVAHVSRARLEHLDSSLADLPTIRAYLAKAWSDLAAHRAFLAETARKVEAPDEGTVLAVMATKAACNEVALRATETAMRVTGGAGFSGHVGVDRPARDAKAGFVMAPTSDALYDFVGRALCGMELF